MCHAFFPNQLRNPTFRSRQKPPPLQWICMRAPRQQKTEINTHFGQLIVSGHRRISTEVQIQVLLQQPLGWVDTYNTQYSVRQSIHFSPIFFLVLVELYSASLVLVAVTSDVPFHCPLCVGFSPSLLISHFTHAPSSQVPTACKALELG